VFVSTTSATVYPATSGAQQMHRVKENSSIRQANLLVLAHMPGAHFEPTARCFEPIETCRPTTITWNATNTQVFMNQGDAQGRSRCEKDRKKQADDKQRKKNKRPLVNQGDAIQLMNEHWQVQRDLETEGCDMKKIRKRQDNVISKITDEGGMDMLKAAAYGDAGNDIFLQ
jgi:hypothetical protein